MKVKLASTPVNKGLKGGESILKTLRSPTAQMVLHARVCGRVGRRPINNKAPVLGRDRGFCFSRPIRASLYLKLLSAPSPIALPPWSQCLLSEFDASDQRAERLAGQLTAEHLNWRPSPDAWSIGQCIEHLCATNDVYLAAISSSLDGRQPSPVQAINPGWFGRGFIRNVVDPSSSSRRVRAPARIQPGTLVTTSILASFLESNQAARELVRRTSDYDVNRIRFRNPFVPLIRFTVGSGLEIVSKHETRHLLQAERVAQSAGFPR